MGGARRGANGNPGLTVVLVTGASVGGTRESLSAVLQPGQRLVDREDGLAQIEAAWGPRDWVPHVTDLFLGGEVDIMVGTGGCSERLGRPGGQRPDRSHRRHHPHRGGTQIRAAPSAVTRSVPGKVAHIWSVTTVDDEHPRGDLDYPPLGRQAPWISRPMPLDGFLPVSSIGPQMQQYAPPDARRPGHRSTPTPSNRPADRSDPSAVADRVALSGLTRAAVRIRAESSSSDRRAGAGGPVVGRSPVACGWCWCGSRRGLAVAGQVPDLVAVAGVISAAAGWAIERGVRGLRARRVRQQLGADGMLLAFGRAGAYHGPRALAPRSSWSPSRMAPGCCVWSRIRRRLAGVRRVGGADLAPRWTSAVHRQARRRARDPMARGAGFGVNKRRRRPTPSSGGSSSRGQLLYTGSAEGAAIAETVRRLDPMDLTTAMYARWG